MRTLKLLVVIGTAVLTAGCVEPSPLFVVSLQPLFTKADRVLEPALVGTWIGEEGMGTFTLEKREDDAYDLLYTEQATSVKLRASLGRLGESLFMDISLLELGVNNPFYAIHLVPAHTIWRVWIEGDVLRLAMLDVAPLKSSTPQEAPRMAREELDWMMLITAPTQELQEYVLRYAEDAEAFPNPLELHRQN